MIRVECANCHNHFFTPPKAAGKSGKCPACGEIIVVPIPGEPGVGTHQDARPPANGTAAPRTHREPAGLPNNGFHGHKAGHAADDHNGNGSSTPDSDNEQSGLKKTIAWLKEIFELEE